jgi:26S proteasome regulatory subunit N10
MGGAGLGGAGFEFGVDPNEDPELALALRVSMEEQRQRQEDEQRRAQAATTDAGETVPAGGQSSAPPVPVTSDESMLERALALSTETPVKRNRVRFTTIFYVLVFFFIKFHIFFINLSILY